MASWRVGRSLGRTLYEGDTCLGVMVGEEKKASFQAARVVRAMNHHDELVAALRHMIECEGDPCAMADAQTTLARIDAEEAAVADRVLDGKVAEAEVENVRLRTQLAAALKERDEARAETAEMWRNFKSMKDERDALKAEVERLERENGALLAEIGGLQDEAANAHLLAAKEINRATDHREALRAENARLKAEVEQLDKLLAEAWAKADALRAAIEPTEANVEALARALPERILATTRTAAWAVLVAIAARAKEPTP